MASQQAIETAIQVSAENIGGIDSSHVSLSPGVNVLSGRNATNRTSFLQAIMAALGSERPSLKGDADEGFVELEFDDDRYTRTLRRGDGGVRFDGDPYLEDAELADLFAFLLESNEARRAVDRDDDLRELIMRPIDTAEIQREISDLEAEKRSIDDRLEDFDRLEGELPALEERRVAIENEIESVSDELSAAEEKLESLDADVEEQQSKNEELEAAFEELRAARRDLESVEYDLETERESRAELEREREELAEELEAVEEREKSPERLEDRLGTLRDRKRSLESRLNDVQSVIRFNEEQLEEGGLGLDDLDPEYATGNEDDRGGSSEDVTEQLLADDDDLVCWTCGSTVDREHIEATLERLRSLHQETLSERNELQSEIDELSARRKELREERRRREELEDRLERIDEELEERAARIEEFEDARDDHATRVERLEEKTEGIENADVSDVVAAHKEVNELELELEDLESEREEVVDRIEEIEATIDERAALEDRRDEIDEELADCRTRVDRIEREAVEAFNDHMDAILSILEYANIDRIWVERRERTVREGRRNVERTAFDLHIVRTTEAGTTYEDTVDHLSESEREVTGLVFALAGYLVHDVHDDVPFMLLDSLEAIDSDRIADLVDYFETYVDCLVVALLPEDASALPDDHTYISDI